MISHTHKLGGKRKKPNKVQSDTTKVSPNRLSVPDTHLPEHRIGTLLMGVAELGYRYIRKMVFQGDNEKRNSSGATRQTNNRLALMIQALANGAKW